jgi:hypothetical protein
MMDLYKQWRSVQEPFRDDVEFLKGYQGQDFAKAVFVELFKINERLDDLEKELSDD